MPGLWPALTQLVVLGLRGLLREWLAEPRLGLARHGSLTAAPRPFGFAGRDCHWQSAKVPGSWLGCA